MARSYKDKTVFITGASSGIGAELARLFAQEGARVALAARRADRLEIVRQTVEAAGGRSLGMVCDVRDRASIEAAVLRTVETFGGIDVAIANAGFGVVGRFAKLETSDFRRQFDTNFFGVLDTIYAVLPHLIASKGQLGIMASVSGRMGAPTASPYAASKFALVGLAESLYYDLAPHGVAVTCINPGFIGTNIRKIDNEGLLHEYAKDPVPKWLMAPTASAARAMVRAMRRERFDAVITGHGKVLVWMARHFPRTLRAATLAASRKVAGKRVPSVVSHNQ